MKVSELGEFGLIDLLAGMISDTSDNHCASWNQLIVGIGDDAAVWHSDAAKHLATIDTLTQDVHFSLSITSWRELGWKALAVNLSDIAAMGGLPGYALVSLALPGHAEVEDVAGLYRGMLELAEQFKVALVGGDTTRAPVVSITIAVFGVAGTGGEILVRSAAKPGDKIAVTGYPGTAAAGWKMLANKLQFGDEVTARLGEAFLCPRPRVAEGQLLARHGVRTAIDISDGLVSDLKHICKASQVSARVNIDRLPVHPMVRDNFGDESLDLALLGGEDYELLFTASPEVIDRVKAAASCPVAVIGEILTGGAGEVNLVDINNSPFKLRKAGWEHFTKN